jgi:hypothetical protein
LNCSLEVAVIPEEEQLLLPFWYVWFPIRAKINLCGTRILNVVGVVVDQRQRESS